MELQELPWGSEVIVGPQRRGGNAGNPCYDLNESGREIEVTCALGSLCVGCALGAGDWCSHGIEVVLV